MTISTVIRFHDAGALRLLERAVQSLHSQTSVSVQPIIVLQRFSQEDEEIVKSAIQRNWFFDEHTAPIIINFHDKKTHDARSQLINEGIKFHLSSGNQYLAFLDYDDYLYSHAYTTLKEALCKSEASVAFSTIEVASVVALKDYEFIYSMSTPFEGKNKLDLIRENFCPIHSYLIKTDSIDCSELYFREDMTRLEDYEFLLRVAGKNPCDFSCLGIKTGCYVMRNDGSNSTPDISETSENRKKLQLWEENRAKLQAQKAGIEVKFYACDF